MRLTLSADPRSNAASGPERTIIAEAGTPFTGGGRRRRAIEALAPSLWPVEAPPDLLPLRADFDACWLDDQRLTTIDAWRAVVEAGRLGDVVGAFALAWQDRNGTVHLARDGVGGRSLFYAEVHGTLACAASLPDLLAAFPIPRDLNRVAAARYLATAYVPGRQTLIAGVFEVLPGEEIVWSRRDGLRRQRFWRLPAAAIDLADEETLRRSLRQDLERAVQRLLPPPGTPLAATLSGGIDSSLVVALARRLHEGPLHTFSVSFGGGYANELPYSSLVATHCSTRHSVVEMRPAAVLHHLDETIALLSDPIGDPLTVPNALLFRAASDVSGVVLNGEGGDPCFGGPKNQPMVLAELYAMPGGKRVGRAESYLRSHLKCYDDFPDMLAPSMHEALTQEPLEAWLQPMLDDPAWPDYVARLQAMNIALKGAHHILPKVDALSRPFGVVPRGPLFDRDVVARSLRLAPRLKLNGAIEKYLLKEAVRDLVPEAIIARPKSGMLVPVEGWFRGPLLPAARERLLDGLTRWNIVERDWLERLLAGQLPGLRPRHGAKIWLLVTLEAWLRTVVTGTASRP